METKSNRLDELVKMVRDLGEENQDDFQQFQAILGSANLGDFG
ncbi:hypothetical protein SLEP1_g40357 [Rubroshorea leprosula]|uniref:Uncharacterized protein n=1 Tax=Rubroshorea leprosula TaxID=152421 RepID=A0AAV5L3J2_9ROSI|nr:hypothetical protein SLEP1_g40357 [Rubroshorea leprosula]